MESVDIFLNVQRLKLCFLLIFLSSFLRWRMAIWKIMCAVEQIEMAKYFKHSLSIMMLFASLPFLQSNLFPFSHMCSIRNKRFSSFPFLISLSMNGANYHLQCSERI